MNKSNIKGLICGFFFYLAIVFIATFWIYVLNIFVPKNADGFSLISLMGKNGVASLWGLVSLFLIGGSIYCSGNICAKYSSREQPQKPIILGFLLIAPALFLGALLAGATKNFEVIILVVLTLVTCVSGHNKYRGA